jgi:hypothetical protein
MPCFSQLLNCGLQRISLSVFSRGFWKGNCLLGNSQQSTAVWSSLGVSVRPSQLFSQYIKGRFIDKRQSQGQYRFSILSHVGVTYKTGFGFDDWIYCHLIHATRDYRQYSAIAILHTFQFIVTHALGFSHFTSRLLATDFITVSL